MATTKYDIVIPQAGTYTLVITMGDGPADLTGYTAEMTIKQTKGSAEVLAHVPPEMFTVEPLNRKVIAEIPDEATAGYDWPRPAVYDVYIEGPGGDRWRLVEGLATLSKTVTQEA